jgi:alkanesulfonate monooxygenase SsuD/methylene tetrahydromethanopterin reductase-like flavin-dependent oxidoreductase (luciferase family)
MHMMYFTEQPMGAYDAKEGLKYGATALTFSNSNYDSVAASRLYNEYLEEYIMADEWGVDGIMLNEHHNAPFCMQARTNMFGAILAAVTKQCKIVFLGNPLPLSDNPVQLAEEIAMIDMVSKGRVVSGFVRGGGQEQLANGVNPAYNRERFVEAHDLITKIWTQPGPFRWEGTHYQHRVVNPWAVPLQKPYPRVWIPGVLSRETVIWTAQQRYPYIALNTAIDATKTIWDTYSKAARDVGYEAGPENFGYLIRVHVQDTEEKAMQNARQFMWMQGEFTGLAHPVWANPAGYFSPSGRRGFVEFAVGRAKNPRGQPTFEEQVADTMIICGTPDQCIERLKHLIEHTRPGIMGLWGNDGTVSATDRRRCIELMVKEVMPAVKEHGKKLGLKDPWEANAPVHLRYSTDIPVQKAAAE